MWLQDNAPDFSLLPLVSPRQVVYLESGNFACLTIFVDNTCNTLYCFVFSCGTAVALSTKVALPPASALRGGGNLVESLNFSSLESAGMRLALRALKAPFREKFMQDRWGGTAKNHMHGAGRRVQAECRWCSVTGDVSCREKPKRQGIEWPGQFSRLPGSRHPSTLSPGGE
jgi:hypothetical protein